MSVAVNPRTVTLTAGASQAFTAQVIGTTNPAVSWTVQEGASGGAVSSAGVYTAPSTPGTYHVVATSVVDGYEERYRDGDGRGPGHVGIGSRSRASGS